MVEAVPVPRGVAADFTVDAVNFVRKVFAEELQKSDVHVVGVPVRSAAQFDSVSKIVAFAETNWAVRTGENSPVIRDVPCPMVLFGVPQRAPQAYQLLIDMLAHEGFPTDCRVTVTRGQGAVGRLIRFSEVERYSFL